MFIYRHVKKTNKKKNWRASVTHHPDEVRSEESASARPWSWSDLSWKWDSGQKLIPLLLQTNWAAETMRSNRNLGCPSCVEHVDQKDSCQRRLLVQLLDGELNENNVQQLHRGDWHEEVWSKGAELLAWGALPHPPVPPQTPCSQPAIVKSKGTNFILV